MDETEAQARVDWLLAQLPPAERERLRGLKDVATPVADPPQLPRTGGGPGGLKFPEHTFRTMAAAAFLGSECILVDNEAHPKPPRRH